MKRRTVILQAIAVLTLVWGVVWAVRVQAAAQRITADKVNREITAARFADWSRRDLSADDPRLASERRQQLRHIAGLLNRLDFQEREKNRENPAIKGFFRKLSPREKQLFVELTVSESMNRFMETLDAMPPDQRRRFIEQGLREVAQGRTAADFKRAEALGADLLNRITRDGIRAYFEKSSMDTKLDLAPLMQTINETMQGLRGSGFGAGGSH